MRAAIRLGLTGGIGSGKSTVARMLASQGAAVIDADAISRQTTAAGGAAIPAIRQVFGPDCITAEGALDRQRMREIAFSDPAARRRLEQIVHPLVAQETQRQYADALLSDVPCVVFDIPLLVESGRWRGQLDHVLVVDCVPSTQVHRVMQRDGLPQLQVEYILANQASRIDRLRAADFVIMNEQLELSDLSDLVVGLARRFGL